MNEKYYYYVAILLRSKDMIQVKGTYSTAKDDFPLREVENYVSNEFKMPINVTITFYKEITEENYKTYNNEP